MDREKQLSTLMLEISNEVLNGNFSREPDLFAVLKEAKEKGLKEIEAKAHINIAGCHFQKGFYDKALSSYDNCIKISQELKNTRLTAIGLGNRSLVYSNIGNRILAIKGLFESLEHWNELGDKNNQIHILSSIGVQYMDMDNFEKGEKYLSKALAESIKHGGQQQGIYINLGLLYEKNAQYEKAIASVKKGLDLALKYNDLFFVSFAYLVLGSINISIKKYDKALAHLESTLRYGEEKGFRQHVLKAIVLKSGLLVEMKDFKQAKQVLEGHILDIDKAKDNANSAQSSRILYEIYKEDKNFEKALSHHEKWIDFRSKDDGIERKNHLDSLEAKYQNELKEKEKEILRLQKVEMEQKAIRAQLNPHFFFNALNSIQNFILDNDKENATRYLRSFSGLMRKTLENSEEMFITIEDEIEFLKDYLSIEQMRLNKSFTFHFEVEEELEEDFVKIPTMLLQPYIENCIKHGVNGIENGKIVVRFSQENEENVLCVIEDNGRGRAIKKEQEHRSMGTKLLEERILALKNQFNVDFSISIIDLKDKLNKPTGTRVEINLPSNLNILLKA